MLAEDLAQRALEKLSVKVRSFLSELAAEKPADPLLTAEQAGKRVGLSASKIRELVTGGYIAKARGITDTRIRQSVIDNYGKEEVRK